MSAVDRARRARRDFDLADRLADRVQAIVWEAEAAGWTCTTRTSTAAAGEIEDPDLVAVTAIGAVYPDGVWPLADGTEIHHNGFDLVCALGVNRRTGRVSVLVDPDRHDARVVVYDGAVPSSRYWWSPKASAIGAALTDPVAFCGLDKEPTPR